jgi:hypothetical protein
MSCDSHLLQHVPASLHSRMRVDIASVSDSVLRLFTWHLKA